MVKIQICVKLDRNKTKKIKFIVFTFISICSLQCLIVSKSLPNSHEVPTKEVDRWLLFRYRRTQKTTKLVKGGSLTRKPTERIIFQFNKQI